MGETSIWWEGIQNNLKTGERLLTPGMGMKGGRQKAFEIFSIDSNAVTIKSGKSLIPLEGVCFNSIQKAFEENPNHWLRAASLHTSQPLENSVDKLVRDATGSQLARGNYICAILEHLALVQYSMRGNKKGIGPVRESSSISERSKYSKEKTQNPKYDRSKLLKVWDLIRWLDEVRWNEEEVKKELIPGPEFKALNADGKIMAHWLSYITDQQRPYQDVWMKGGPVFAELVSAYKTTSKPSIDLLKEFTTPSEKRGGVDAFRSKSQLINGEILEYRPRFGMHILSIARVLIILESFQRSFANYLSHQWWFVQASKNIDGDNWVSRMAFLLYLLAYEDITRGLVSYNSNENKIKKNAEGYMGRLNKLFSNKDRLLQAFQEWSKRDKYHKRLWASLRDYLKPESPFYDHFAATFSNLGNKEIGNFLAARKSEVYGFLEVPGDIWNLRFLENIFNGSITSPEDLRSEYERLKLPSNLRTKYYPEQFDVSFSFSPYMCDEMMEDFCPFRVKTRIKEYCIGFGTDQYVKRLCPVAMIACGYTCYCKPESCPIKDGLDDDLCPGCSVNVVSKK